MCLSSQYALLKSLPGSLHFSWVEILSVRGCSAYCVESRRLTNALCKSAVKNVARFYEATFGLVLKGFLFVFPEANLYNAARLAGRVSFKVIFK